MPMTPHDLVLEAKAQIKEVDTAEAQTLLGKRVIIDVREYDEYARNAKPRWKAQQNAPWGCPQP